MASSPRLKNAYRVLDAQGRVSSAFRWPDPGDSRDVRQVLQEERIAFDDEGRAEADQRLTAADLAGLIEYEFDPDELQALKQAQPESSSPWLTDGRSWHLDHVCLPKTREILLGLEALITEVAPEAPQPDWTQKYYVAWRSGGRRWLGLHTRQSWIWIDFSQPPVTAEEASRELGYTLVPAGHWPSMATSGPGQVQMSQGRLWIQIKDVTDLEGERGQILRALIGRAWVAARAKSEAA